MNESTLKIIPWASLAVCVMIVTIITLFVHDVVFHSDQDRFDKITNHLTEDIRDRMKDYETTLYGAKGLFAASEQVTRSEWKQYASIQQIEKRFPGMKALVYSKKIGNSEDLKSHIQKMHLDYPTYDVHPMYSREEYHSIVYVEPFESSNLRAFGYDMSTESVRHAAMVNACDSDNIVFSGKITLIQEPSESKQPGFLMLLPIYKNGYPIDTIEQKRASLDGFVYFAFRAHDLFGAIFEKLEEDPNDIKHLTVEIYDSSVGDSNLLYSSGPLPAGSFYLQTIQTISLGEQQWLIRTSATNEFSNTNNLIVPITVLLGLGMSLLLFLVIRSFSINQLYVLKLAKINERLLAGDPDVLINAYDSQIDKSTQKLFDTISQMRNTLAKSIAEQQITKQKDEFSAMITHELKTPLVPIIGYTKMLKGLLGPLNAEQQQAADIIYKNATSLNSLINDILDAQKLELKKIKYTIAPLSIKKLFESLREEYAPVINGKLEFSFSDDLIIQTDEIRLHQVFSNIINNAINVIPKTSGIIEVGLQKQNDSVVFHIRNNGPQIPQENQEQLFQKFYQMDSSIRRKPGSGLGLAICKGIIEGLGGQIWLESNKDWTAFYFRIPIL